MNFFKSNLIENPSVEEYNMVTDMQTLISWIHVSHSTTTYKHSELRVCNECGRGPTNIVTIVFQPSTPTKPVVFADWLDGVSPPVPNTINKHVHDMVEVSIQSVYRVVYFSNY